MSEAGATPADETPLKAEDAEDDAVSQISVLSTTSSARAEAVKRREAARGAPIEDSKAEDDITAADSVSQISAPSTTSSARARASMRRAALENQAMLLQREQQMNDAMIRMKQELQNERRREKRELEIKQRELEIKKQELDDERERMKQELENERHRLENENARVQMEMRIQQAKIEEMQLDEAEERESMASAHAFSPDAEVFLRNSSSKMAADKGADADRKTVEENRSISLSSVKEINITPTTSEANSTFFEQQKQLISLMHAPKVDIPYFDGNPLHYYSFIRAFEDNVERMVDDSGARLARLRQYCTGKAEKLLQCCAIMNPNEGYTKARQLLKERFGNEIVICQAWMDMVSSTTAIRPNDGQALQEFADNLRNCHETLQAMGCTSEIGAQSSLLKIVNVLPTYLQNQWRKEGRNIRTKRGRLPRLEEVVVFIENAADEANDPIYGFKTEERSVPKRQISHNVIVNPEREMRSCPICGDPHQVIDCEKFKGLSSQDKSEACKEKRLCFNCLKPGHRSELCRSTSRCERDGCGRKHSSLMHRDYWQPRNQEERTDEIAMTNANNGYADTSCFSGAGMMRIALPIVAVKVRAPGTTKKSITTYALLDSGSTNSFCSKKLLDKLGVEGVAETLSLTTLEKVDSVYQTRVASLEVTDVYDRELVQLPLVYAKEALPINHENVATFRDVADWPHLRGIDLPIADTDEVMLLIGQDTPEALIPINVVRGEKDEPYATKTRLGWSLNGPLKQTKLSSSVTSNFISTKHTRDERLEGQVEQFWKIDSAGMFDDERGLSINDRKVIAKWEKTVHLQEGHYKMPIPFKEPQPVFPDNKSMAEHRLESLGKKLNKNRELKSQYIIGIEDLLEKGYAKEVRSSEEEKLEKMWYLPHHPVINPQKGKVRIVFDCAARFRGTSLNSAVHQGPDLTNKLIGVLMRFRLEEVAFMADVQAMFHQVMVAEEDQDVLRFLWWPDGDTSSRPKSYKMTVHLFGGTWSPSCCNFALQRTIEDNEDEFSEDTRNTVLKNFYVDDCLKSVATVKDAINISLELKALLKKGGFNLTKWICNRPEVMEAIPEEDRSEKAKHMNMDSPVEERALGVFWDIENDNFRYKIYDMQKSLTKRGLLSMMSSIYDPLGFASAFILKAKRIVQELCRLKTGWDEPIPQEQRVQWEAWLEDLPNMRAVEIPRCIQQRHNQSCITNRQLHHFGDASEIAYGTTSYLRVAYEDGSVDCSLIMAKSRLAPLKKMTIPRLELSAAALAIKQDKLIRRELGVETDGSFFWTDSTIVLQYIKSESRRFHTFVSNRVAMIRDGSDVEEWRHVEGSLNPADIASRGSTAAQLNSERWLRGPKFLALEESAWPNSMQLVPIQSDDPEVKNEKMMQTFATTKVNERPLDQLLKAHSCWRKLLISAAWFIAIKKLLTHQEILPEMLQSRHLMEAELSILRYVQRRAFQKDHETSSLKNLNPVEINGVLRVGGRLRQAPLPKEMTTPIILPKEGHVTELLVRHVHESNGHAGREYVLSILREKYWLIGARTVIRQVLLRCVVCKKRDANPTVQQMADLPKDRVTPGEPAFTYTGVDYFGPFHVKRGRGTEKRYGCLFTCLTTRGIHIEVAHTLDADSFINCLHRFTARRGCPKLIRSDNGTNFVGAERELAAELKKWNKKKIQDEMNNRGIEWKFNPPLASHMGGVWERQIRTVRRVLAGITKEQVLSDEALSTFMCMAENIVNNRPITTVSTDPADMEALTPNHLMLLRAVTMPPGTFDKHDTYSRKKWRQVQYLADVFWRRWTKEYLPQLQKRHKWIEGERSLQCGDIVLVMDSLLPRNEWLLGRVVEVMPGRDGKVRSVKVKTKRSELVRPISKLSLLEEMNVVDEKAVAMERLTSEE